MSSPEDVFRQLESDRAVREREIRIIQNLARRASDDSERGMLFRSLVLLTYAHLEGFCRGALITYLTAINALRLKCEDASYVLVAASLTDVFGALRNPQSKHPIFARILPDDAKLHLLAREIEFIEKLEQVVGLEVGLPDNAVDTESNLSPKVLKKNLFKLGLDYSLVNKRQDQLNKLLGIRNAIAHGDMQKIPKEEEVQEYTSSAFQVMSFIQGEIYAALEQQVYLRKATAA